MIVPHALDGIRIVSLASNIPGPLAAARCAQHGAQVTKIEPRRGDALEHPAPRWYRDLVHDQCVLKRDLREPAARAELYTLLRDADVLISAMRASALARLGLDWSSLHAQFPQLCHVAVVGERPPHGDRAGHDLTYQARAGLISPPTMPRTLVGDLAAADRAVAAVFATLFQRERTGEATRAEIAIVDCANDFALPLHHGLTTPDGSLGGALPLYGLYRARDGWVALAALEAHFIERLPALLGTNDFDADALGRVFETKTAAEWEAQAVALDIPLAKVHDV